MTETLEKYAQKAVAYDKNKNYEAAIYFYSQAAEEVLRLVQQNIIPVESQQKAVQYIERAEQLKALELATPRNVRPPGEQASVERAEFIVYQAIDADSRGQSDEAIELYLQALEMCLQLKKSSSDAVITQKLGELAQNACERAETLKRAGDNVCLAASVGTSSTTSSIGLDRLYIGETSSTSRRQAGGYTPAEIDVLRRTSTINARDYVPFMNVDLRERFAYPVPFSDKDGLLALAGKQRTQLERWARPDEFVSEPTIIAHIDSGTIKQTIVSDCSFVASLAVAARYENRFSRPLVTNLIYPQNKQARPVYNPCGKYMVRLHINGVARKVIIDDHLPLGARGQLLCSHSQRREELWVSLLEKAYMKVMGGYDFPGSNSNIDLHALTGWIPERAAIGGSDWNGGDELFTKLLDRHARGDCLVTVATGKLSEVDQQRSGLVECHAYAMLDVRRVENKRMLLLKNPWTHLRWKGRYSEMDTASWTPQLQSALNYDPLGAQQFDDGVFWIDFESVSHFFDVFYINWNPSLFPYTYCYHSEWQAGSGPIKDLYSVGDNPQYALSVHARGAGAAVWILLTRHITDKADFADNKEFITVLVYAGARRVYYPFEPRPISEGVRINSPHYLCKLVLPVTGNSDERTDYTLVVAQYEQLRTIYYSLRVYSTVEFTLKSIAAEYAHVLKETGEWKGHTAGGCANYRDTYASNPMYEINMSDSNSDANQLCIELRGPKQFSVGFELKQARTGPRRVTFDAKPSGSYRPGYCVLTVRDIPAGVYTLVPTTFLPHQEGPYMLRVQCSAHIKLLKIRG